MAFRKGQGGRPKGVPNKVTGQVKEMVLRALTKAGGEKYLFEQSQKNPVAFLTLVGKAMPLQVGGDPDAPLITRVIHEDYQGE